MTAILKGKALADEIKAIAKDAKAFEARLHIACASVCAEAIATGNLTHLMQLDAAVEHVGRRAVRRWLAKHGPVSWDNEAKAFKFNETKRKEAIDKGVDAYGKELLAAPTYTAEATKSDTDPFTAFDVFAMLERIVAKGDAVDLSDARHNVNGLHEVRQLVERLRPTYVKPGKVKTVEAMDVFTAIPKAEAVTNPETGEVPFTPAEIVKQGKTSKQKAKAKAKAKVRTSTIEVAATH